MADKTLLERINQGRNYRSLKLECRAREENEEEKYIVEGYASTFNEEYLLGKGDGWEFYERVDPKAFDNADMSDVIMQFDHEGRVYARKSNETLEVITDKHGLFIRAYLGGTELGRQLFEDIKGGYVNKMSFGFTVNGSDEKEERTKNGTKYTRTITSVEKLYDVSAVSLPANDGTEISARSYIDGVMSVRQAQEQKQQAEDEEKKLAEEEQKQKEKELRERLRLRELALSN